jgi:hypothetical protein
MGKVSRGWWFGGFQLCSFLSPNDGAEVHRAWPTIAQPTGHVRGSVRYPFIGGFCFLVATPRMQDLLFSAKHLFGRCHGGSAMGDREKD